ncbi:hypothetical protein BH11ARM2_BH11ARM2_02590 [soil metagenome]
MIWGCLLVMGGVGMMAATAHLFVRREFLEQFIDGRVPGPLQEQLRGLSEVERQTLVNRYRRVAFTLCAALALYMCWCEVKGG